MPTFKCPQCGSEFQADVEGRYTCPTCENTVAVHLHVHGKIPWETWREQSRWRAFWATWKQVMKNPVAFFRRVPPQGNFILPLYYGIICQSVAIILIWAFQAGLNLMPSILNYITAFGGYTKFTLNTGPAMAIFFMALVVVAPIFAVVGLFMQSVIYHICLKIFGGAGRGFEATFRAIAYASSAQFLGIIPIVGGIIAGIWSLILGIIGVKEIHGTTYPKAIMAVILPVVVCCGIIILVVTALFGAALGMWMGEISA